MMVETIRSSLYSRKQIDDLMSVSYFPILHYLLSTGSSEPELLKLQKMKLRAMDIKDTLERLEDSILYVQDNISLVAAKLAIQSLDSRL